MTEASPLDDRGRFTVEPRYREMLGKRVIQIWTPHGLLLRPLKGLSKEELKRLGPAAKASGDEAAMEEIEDELRETRGRP